MSLFYHPAAKVEERAAIAWYGKKGRALAGRLRDELRLVYDRAMVSPKQFPVAVADCRRGLATSFPYSVFFVEISGDICVLAVAHTSREPNYWLDRRLQFPPPAKVQ